MTKKVQKGYRVRVPHVMCLEQALKLTPFYKQPMYNCMFLSCHVRVLE